MIQANELRIGNWYYLENPMASAKVPEQLTVWTQALDFQGYGVPIHLTPEILEKAGFKREAALQLYHCCEVEIGYLENGGNSYDFFFSFRDQTQFIKYVHQLQNLYHALTGEELIINL